MQGLDTCASVTASHLLLVCCVPRALLSAFPRILSLDPHSHPGTLRILSRGWMRKLSPREVEPLAPSHPAGKW